MLRLILTASTVWALAAAAAGGGGLVTREDANLTLNDRPFMYAGANNYYVGIDNLTAAAQPDTGVIDEIIADAKAMNLNVLRVWGFNDHDTPVEPWWRDVKASRLQTRSGGAVYQRDGTHGGDVDGGVDYFRGLDCLLARAADNDMRVILPLVNNWQDYGGMAQYVNWSTDAPIPNADGANLTWRTYKNAFYTDPGAQGLYRAYVDYLANRVNTCNGRRYGSDETILAWQLANEPRMATYAGGSHAALDAWVAETADYLKNVAGVSQLVTVGMEGYYDDAAANTAAGGNAWFQHEGTDYVANHAHAGIDLAGFHLYQQPWGLSDADSVRWIADHVRTARQGALNRPAVMDEVAYGCSGGDTAERDAHFKQYLRTAYREMASGVNFWILYHDAYGDYDGYGVYYPADAGTVDVIRRYGRKVQVFNKTGVHQLLAFEYDLDGFDKVAGQGAQAVVRVDGEGWFVTADGAVEIACGLAAGEAFTVGAELIDPVAQDPGIDVTGFGYQRLLARVMADGVDLDDAGLVAALYDRTGDGWDLQCGGGVTVASPGQWYELAWDAQAAGDLADLKELGIRLSAAGGYAGRVYVEFIGGDLTPPGDNQPHLGDANWDGRVDYLDLGVLATSYDATGARWEMGDFDLSGTVDYIDLGILATYYGTGGAAELPEPSCLLMTALALAAAGRTKRRQTRPGGH